jgi:hypothetical protein
MREESHRSGLRKSELFFARQLDDPNQLDPAHEISFYAHAIGGAWSVVTRTPSRRFCRSGKSVHVQTDAFNRQIGQLAFPGLPRKRSIPDRLQSTRLTQKGHQRPVFL